jgi:subtilisin family serine protease
LWIGSALSEPSPLTSTRRAIIVLEGTPVSGVAASEPGPSLYKGLTRKPARAKTLLDHRAALERQQENIIGRLRALSPSVRIERRFTGLINGLAVEMPVGLEAEVGSWPEVLAVVPTRRYRPLLNVSNPLMGAAEAWEKTGGDHTAGRGIKIGIIDSGIDHTHVMFDDTGYELPEGFPLGETTFTNKKIIVARAFSSGVFDTTADSTPRDRDGHGTHSAACAAGRLDTPSPLGSISGVAPNAYLGNYKVFTEEYAESDQLIAALEACVEDGMDVVNMSLGSDEYVETPLDPEAVALRNAITSGVVVVTAAGNSGQAESIGSPGQIPEVITVGSVSNGHSGYDSSTPNEAILNVYADGEQILTEVKILLADDPDFLSRPIVGRFPLIDADVLDGGSYGGETDGLMCTDLPSGSADGKWVLAQRGVCTFASKIDRIQAAGGWGALIYNSTASQEKEDPDLPVPFPSVPGTEIPAYFVGRSAGLGIKQAIHEHRTLEVEFTTTPPTEQSQTPFEMSSFSSLGPTVDYTIKPDLVAVGGWSYAAVQDDAPNGGPSGNRFRISGFDFVSGTSFASPRVAGAAALVKQAHPQWDPERIKSALVVTGDRPSPLNILPTMTRGGGHVSVDEAVDVPILALPPTLSFCRRMVSKTATAQHTFTLENVSNADQSLSLRVEVRTPGLLGSSSVIPSEVVLRPGGRKEATLTLVFDPPAALAKDVDMDGDVVIEAEGLEEPLRVPFWVRAIRAPEAKGSVLLVDDDSDKGSEVWYEAAVRAAGYDCTTWDMMAMGQCPDGQYMLNFRTVVWFMATTSLYEISNEQGEERFKKALNDRIRFSAELTRYLARGGSLLVSGQDWSDAQEETPFGQYVLHVRPFDKDPHYSADELVRTTTIVTVSGSPVATGISTEDLHFDTDFENWTSSVKADSSGYAKAAFRSLRRPAGDVGVTVESCSYRVVFLGFALERLSESPMNRIIKNSLSWLGDKQPESLSILSIEPSSQPDNSSALTVALTVTGVNFPVGNYVRLDEINLPVTSFKECGRLEVVVPAGLPNSLYDVSVQTPDGQVATVPNIFKVGKGDVPTGVAGWELY